MARSRYHQFLDGARELYGFSYREAQEFYSDVRERLGERPGLDDLASDEALDVLDDIFPEEAERYADEDDDDVGPADRYFEHVYGSDDIIEPDEEIEVTVHLEYRGRR